MTTEIDYYETYYTEFLDIKRRDNKGNIWLEFAKWLLSRFGKGTIESPSEEGLMVWNNFYKQQFDKNKGNMDILMVRADDNVQRRSLVEPELPHNEEYETYKASMIRRQEEALAYKKQQATVYKGFLCEDNIDVMGAEDRDFMTQREWEEAERRKKLKEAWLLENKDRFIQEAFELLDKTIVSKRALHQEAITERTKEAETWDLTIPDSKKDKMTLAKQLKEQWYFKDAVSGLSIAGLDTLLTTKITEHKETLKKRVINSMKHLSDFERLVGLWTQYRSLSIDEMKELDRQMRIDEKPVLKARTTEAVAEYNGKMSLLNDKLKILHKLSEMKEKGIRCMDMYRGNVGGLGDYFEIS